MTMEIVIGIVILVIILALIPHQGGSRLRIESARDERGFPQGGPQWVELLRPPVEKAARGARLEVTRGSVTHTRSQDSAGRTRWVLAQP